MKLAEFVIEDAIITDLTANSKENAIREMVKSLCEAGRFATENEENIVAAIMKREELGSTGIGRGIAVPHTKHPSVDSLVATIAIAREGVEFQSLDGEDVHILFLLISPPDRPGDHLRGLEGISRHLKNDDFCNFLRQSKTAADVMELLREADEDRL
ncbi:MAG: PTS sugar transporter subunit IIA [Planctomycetaceae bacterium]|nr:PTS sugar transporter subunit IIA [Planctomycetaceae bacterium]MCA9110203.1 PTS sugar transporter subunit IIA [Planctomycetaceae bacterium]